MGVRIFVDMGTSNSLNIMKYKELLEKYNILLSEINRLKEENSQLKAQLGQTESGLSRYPMLPDN